VNQALEIGEISEREAGSIVFGSTYRRSVRICTGYCTPTGTTTWYGEDPGKDGFIFGTMKEFPVEAVATVELTIEEGGVRR